MPLDRGPSQPNKWEVGIRHELLTLLGYVGGIWWWNQMYHFKWYLALAPLPGSICSTHSWPWGGLFQEWVANQVRLELEWLHKRLMIWYWWMMWHWVEMYVYIYIYCTYNHHTIICRYIFIWARDEKYYWLVGFPPEVSFSCRASQPNMVQVQRWLLSFGPCLSAGDSRCDGLGFVYFYDFTVWYFIDISWFVATILV